jgi:hypothetical protein
MAMTRRSSIKVNPLLCELLNDPNFISRAINLRPARAVNWALARTPGWPKPNCGSLLNPRPDPGHASTLHRFHQCNAVGRMSLSSKPRISVPGIPTGLRPPAQGCEARATLGEDVETRTTLKGLRPDRSKISATPLGLVMFERIPKVARSSQPWAGGHNPFGIEHEGTCSKTGIRPTRT